RCAGLHRARGRRRSARGASRVETARLRARGRARSRGRPSRGDAMTIRVPARRHTGVASAGARVALRSVASSALVLACLLRVALAASLPPIPVELHVGQVHLIRAGELKRIAVGNGKVLQATALDGGQVLVIPEAPGQSTLHLWGVDGTESRFEIHVVPADANRLLAEVRAMLGERSRIRARIVGDKVVLEGNEIAEEE